MADGTTVSRRGATARAAMVRASGARIRCFVALVGLMPTLVAGCGFGGEGSRSSATATTTPRTPSPELGVASVAGIVERVQPSVVTILVDGGVGSGVVYRRGGLIVTNEHVIRGRGRVTVALADGARVGARVIALDPVTDLAVLAADRRDLPPARFQQRLPRVGDLAIVVGSPLGFQNSVSSGIISGLHRDIPGSASQSQALVDLLQTDAAISPGNSGGAVVDARGDVVGISEAYIPPSAGAVALGFAIPAQTVVRVAEQLRTSGRAEHAFAGIEPTVITPELARALGLAASSGVAVLAVTEDGPAARAGIRPGDIIVRFAETETPTPEAFLAALRGRRPGETVSVTLRRDVGTVAVRLKLAARPS